MEVPASPSSFLGDDGVEILLRLLMWLGLRFYSGSVGQFGLLRRCWGRSTWCLLQAFEGHDRDYRRWQGLSRSVVFCWCWGWFQLSIAGLPLCRGRSCCSCWAVGFAQAFLCVEMFGMLGELRPQFGVKLERGFEGEMVEAWRFGFTRVFQAIWCGDRAAMIWQLLVIVDLLVWINAEEWFDVKKGGWGVIYQRICLQMQMCCSRELSSVAWAKRLALLADADCGAHWYGRGDGNLVVLVVWMSSVPNPSVLLLYIVLLLVFGSACRSQINSYSFEFELVSKFPMGVWCWIFGPLCLGPNLLLAFGPAIVHQPALRILTLMSMSDARSGYLIGMRSTLDQLCYLLVYLTQSCIQSGFRLDPLIIQLLFFVVRIASLSNLLLSLYGCSSLFG